VWIQVSPRNQVLYGDPDAAMHRGNFEGENVICMANGWLKEQDLQLFYSGI